MADKSFERVLYDFRGSILEESMLSCVKDVDDAGRLTKKSDSSVLLETILSSSILACSGLKSKSTVDWSHPSTGVTKTCCQV